MEQQLTRGALALMYEGEAKDLQPVLQVRELRLLSNLQNPTERYTMVLSDGTHMQRALLATQLNAIVHDQSLQAGSIVQLHEFFCNVIQGRRIIIITQIGVIQRECELIGAPRMYEIGSYTRTYGSAEIPQTEPFINPNSQLPVINPIDDESTTISNMVNKLNLETLKSDKQSPNQNFQHCSPDSTKPDHNSYSQLASQISFHQHPPLYRNRGPVASSEVPPVILPISNLNPCQGQWIIKARVSSKSELRTYANPAGDGKVFFFDLIDSERGEIRVTCFNKFAEQFYPKIDLGKVYLISRGNVKQANKRFNPLSHEFELSLDTGSIVQPCEDDNTIPGVNFNFCQISDIGGMANDTILDVIGVVTFIYPACIVRRKNGNETLKCTLQLMDMSGFSVELTFWGNFVNSEVQQLRSMCEFGQSPILAIKTCRINEFNGKSVSSIPGTQLFIDPDCAEAEILRAWYSTYGKSAAATSISFKTAPVVGRPDSRKTIKHIEDEGLGHGCKPDWVIIKGMVTHIKVDNYCYTACPNQIGGRQCNKKVTSNGDSTWWCYKCDQNFLDCNYRYLLQFQIQDHTGSMHVTAFEEVAEQIMGTTAKELFQIESEEQNHDKFTEAIRSVLFKQFIFNLRVKEEIYNGGKQVKSTAVRADVVEPSSESKYLLGLIDEMLVENQSLNQNLSPNHILGNRKTCLSLCCNNCGSNGHNGNNCPVINRQVDGGSSLSNIPQNNLAIGGGNPVALPPCAAAAVYSNCQQPGHRASYCPGMASGSKGYAASIGDGSTRGWDIYKG